MLVTIEVEVPDWAKYLSQDEDGLWWVWEEKPSPKIIASSGYWDSNIAATKLIGLGSANPNWQSELYELIQE